MSRLTLVLALIAGCTTYDPYWTDEGVPNNGPSDAEQALCLEVEERDIDLGEIDLVQDDNPFPVTLAVRNTCGFPVGRVGLTSRDRITIPVLGGRIPAESASDINVSLLVQGRGEGVATADLLINNTQLATRVTWSWEAVGPEFVPVEEPEPLEVRLGCRGARRVVLENIGEHEADVQEVLFNYPRDGLDLTSDAPTVVAPGETLTVDVTWTPRTIQGSTATILPQYGAEPIASGLVDPPLSLVPLEPDPDTPCP